MIEARVDTIMRGVDTPGGGLYPAEITKRKKRQEKQKKEKKVCRGAGCITNIVSYNRDHRGHLETLCYKCRKEVGYPGRDHVTDDERNEKKRREYKCKNGHVLSEVGKTKRGGCRQCATDLSSARWAATAARRGNSIPVLKASRVALTQLSTLMEERSVSVYALERKTGIPGASLRGYMKVGGDKGCKCSPERAKMIAGYFRVTVAELAGEAEEEMAS